MSKYLDDSGLSYFWGKLKTKLAAKQDTLVSGTNIKTVNNESLLGSGNISISGGTSNIFIAIYGSTTYAEVLAAWRASKDIIVFYSNSSQYAAPFYLMRVGDPQSNATFTFIRLYRASGDAPKWQTIELTSSGWPSVEEFYVAELASPTFTGTPKAPTAAAGTSTTQIATTAFVQGEISGFESKGEMTSFDTKSSITSLANLKTQLTTWYSAIPNNTVRQYYITPSGSWSPFTSGTGIIVEIERAATNGTASFYGRTNDNPVYARMMYYNSAWPDFYVMATTDDITTAEPFIATYNTTTYSDITTALSAGRAVYCHYVSGDDDIILPYVCTTEAGIYVFTNMVGNTCWRFYLNSSGTWSNGKTALAATQTTASLAVASWSNKSITVTVNGVTTSNLVIVSPAPASAKTWAACGVICTTQAANKLTFTCESTPTVALTANIAVWA